MVMPAGYFKLHSDKAALKLIKTCLPSLDTIWEVGAARDAYLAAVKLAQIHTNRNKILILADPSILIANGEDDNYKTIPAGDASQLCATIANSEERVAAIIIQYHQASHFYYRKVRELASAEGALMIWDRLNEPDLEFQYPIKIAKDCQPDILIFNFDQLCWLSSKKNIIETPRKSVYQLPDGQWIYDINTYETEFVVKEIFLDNCYLQHGINLKKGSIVFDVGANIGLFSLYVKQKFPTTQIYAFEPAPEVYSILKNNTSFLGTDIHLYNIGLADCENQYPFYYYPGYSVISGFYANKQKDSEVIISGMKAYAENDDLHIESLVKERLEQIDIVQCQVTTLSNIMQQNKISAIDLLKIDVEGAELSILKGIAQQHWRKIWQIAMEVHHKKDLDTIVSLLHNKSFTVHVEINERLGASGIYNLFAIRNNYGH